LDDRDIPALPVVGGRVVDEMQDSEIGLRGGRDDGDVGRGMTGEGA
jgi:hypothetical protein